MAYSSAHILVRFNGHFGTVSGFVDRWSCGLRFGIAGSDVAYDEAKLQTFVQSAFAAGTTFHADSLTLAGTAAWLDNASAARIGTNGRYQPTTQVTKFSTGSSSAGVGTVTLPWNTALVISLRTPNPRGYASNGRVYWPCLAASVAGGTGRVTSTVVNNRLQNFKALINTLNTAANVYDPGMKLRVMSNVGGGTSADVTSIRSDDRFDSIERRENEAPIVYTSTTIP